MTPKTQIRKLKLPNGKHLLVEVQKADPDDLPHLSSQASSGIPGTEPVGVIDDSIELVQENIKNMAGVVHESLKELAPNEWSVEMHIGFKGKTNIIPYIVSAGVEGGIKVKATWKKDE